MAVRQVYSQAYSYLNLQQDLRDTFLAKESGSVSTPSELGVETDLLWPHYPLNQVVTVLQRNLHLLNQRYYLELVFNVITALPSLGLEHLALLTRFVNLWHLELSTVEKYPTCGQNLNFFVNGHSIMTKVDLGNDRNHGLDRDLLLTWLDSYAEILQRIQAHPHYHFNSNFRGSKASHDLAWIQTKLGLLLNYP